MRTLACLVFLACSAPTAQQTPDRPAGTGVNFYSKDKEAAMGAQLAAEVRRNAKVVDSPAVAGYLARTGGRLAAQMPDIGFALQFTVVANAKSVTNEPMVLPGGYIFVSTDLFGAARDEAEFAGMMAHAVAHVAGRDATRQASRGSLTNLATIPLVFTGGWAGFIQQQSAGTLIPISLFQFQRASESAADFRAVGMMAAAGWDPETLARYIEREQAPPNAPTDTVFSPLPDRNVRVVAIRKAIGNLPAREYSTSAEFTAIQAEVRSLAAGSAPQGPPPPPR